MRIARIERHDIGNFQHFVLREVLDEIAGSYGAVAADAGFELDYKRPLEKVEMAGDGDVIAQLVINLIQNAITHAGKGATVALSVKRSGKRLF